MAKINVRIAVAVDPDGKWNAVGFNGSDDADKMMLATEVVSAGEARYWLTATLDVPEAREIEANVEKA